MYIFIRKDIPKHYQIIQASHATWEHGLKNEPLPNTTHFCLLEAKDEADLDKIAEKIERKGFTQTRFNEPDFDTGNTAIACGPFTDEADRKFFKRFRMYRD